MHPRVLLPLLLLCACAAPLPPASGTDRRSSWQQKVQAIQPSWGRKELEAFLDDIRVPSPHRPGNPGGGWYSLDEDFSLYVVWKEETATQGIRSSELTCFSDLRDQVAPDLFEALRAIHQSPSPHEGLSFGSLRLIRAVNVLQPLGRERALKALWEYNRLACSDLRKYGMDEYRILPIIQLLFESPGGRMPEFRLGVGDIEFRPDEDWPLFPIALVKDVPFMMMSGYTLAGRPQPASSHLRLKLGPLRAAPLAPPVSPLEAADDLTQSDAWKALRLGPGNEGRKRWQIRRQALGALASVFAPRPEETSNDCCVDPTEAQWRATVERARSAVILWSPELQDFIIGR